MTTTTTITTITTTTACPIQGQSRPKRTICWLSPSENHLKNRESSFSLLQLYVEPAVARG